jgi:hypothetical protein
MIESFLLPCSITCSEIFFSTSDSGKGFEMTMKISPISRFRLKPFRNDGQLKSRYEKRKKSKVTVIFPGLKRFICDPLQALTLTEYYEDFCESNFKRLGRSGKNLKR